jgi:hypothetical protein
MAQYTVTLNDTFEEPKLQWLLDRENEDRARRGQGAITKQQFVNGWFNRDLEVEYRRRSTQDGQELRNAYENAPEAVKDSVRDVLEPYRTP